MRLTGPEIAARLATGQIVIEPFVATRINPCSYNVSLARHLRIWTADQVADPLAEDVPPAETHDLTAGRYLLRPGCLCLAATVEYTESHDDLQPMLAGRSSLARLGLSIHQTAGFGDPSFRGAFTLELSSLRPIYLYLGLELGQIAWQTTLGEYLPYDGNYQGQIGPTESRMWLGKKEV